MRHRVAFASLAAAFLLAPASVTAQAAWDAPMLLAPGAPAGFGLHLVDPGAGAGLGVLGTWRSSPAPVGLGFRVGVVEDAGGDAAVMAGVDVSGAIMRTDTEVPVDLMWFSGAGVGLGYVTLSVPIGVAAGASFVTDDVIFRPWIAPRIVLDAYLESDTRRDDDLELGLAVEIGLDLQLDQPWAIQASGAFGDRDSVSIGIVVPTGWTRR